jgi:hypothetical protein
MLALIGKLVDLLAQLIAADGDAAKEEEALMRLAELTKAELDWRQYGP